MAQSSYLFQQCNFFSLKFPDFVYTLVAQDHFLLLLLIVIVLITPLIQEADEEDSDADEEVLYMYTQILIPIYFYVQYMYLLFCAINSSHKCVFAWDLLVVSMNLSIESGILLKKKVNMDHGWCCFKVLSNSGWEWILLLQVYFNENLISYFFLLWWFWMTVTFMWDTGSMNLLGLNIVECNTGNCDRNL